MEKHAREDDYSGRGQDSGDNTCTGGDYSNEPDPPLEATGLKRQGWILIIAGLVVILFSVLSPHHLLYWYYLPLQMGMALLAVAAGLKLIRRHRRVSSSKDGHSRS